MNGKKAGAKGIELPVLEVLVRNEAAELACLAFFSAGGEGWDILVGVDDTANRDALFHLFTQCAEAVKAAAFRPTRAWFDEGGDNAPPF